MNKAVQEATQERYEPVQPEKIVTTAWKPRTDGKTAMLINNRGTVFDRPAEALKPADPVEAISDPIWDHRGFTSWTPDLVHCRLLVAGEVLVRLPPVLRKGYVSQLGNIAITEASTRRHIPPTPEEITLADWTLVQIAARQHRQILMASAFGFSADKIAETLKARGEKISGPTVQRHYIAERRCLAAIWQRLAVPVDSFSGERWGRIFARRK